MLISVEVYSDVICPWCYVGKRRLEGAITRLGNAHQVRVKWLPFQLNPEMPKEGMNRIDYRTRKFGSVERSRELESRFLASSADVQIPFDFDRVERTPNTLDAHRLIWLADQRGCQDRVMENLFRAYFVEGKDLCNRATLTEIVCQSGLDHGDVDQLLDSDQGQDEIREAAAFARRNRIEGVPLFILNQEIVLSGAQPVDTFLAAFQHFIVSENVSPQSP